MDTVNKALDTALAFQRFLKEAGINVVIAGGAARDLYLNTVPADYDVCVLDTDPIDCKEMQDLLVEFRILKDEPVSLEEVYANGYDEGFQEQHRNLEYVYKCKVAGVDIDVIRVAGANSTPELLDSFDYPINQCYLDLCGKPLLYGNMKHVQVPLRVVGRERVEHMQSKLPYFSFIPF